MNRKALALGLVLTAALATSAIVLSAAQAEGEKFTAASYPVTISGSGEQEFVYVEGAGTEKCKSGFFDGTLNEPSTTLELTPTYSECTIAGLQIKTTMNGCAFKEKPKENLGADKFRITTDLACPAGQVMEKHRPMNCTLTFAPQEMGYDVFEDDTKTGKVIVLHQVTSFTYTVDKGAGCLLKAGVFKGGSIKGGETLSAQNSEGAAVSFDIF